MSATEVRTASSRKSDVPVSSVMARDLLTCPPDTTIAQAASWMQGRRSSSIVILDEGQAVGIWTEHDALKHDLASAHSFDAPISSAMSSPVETIASNATLADAALRFQQQNFRHYLVINAEGQPAGMLSRTDIVVNHGVEWFMRLRTAGSVVQRAALIGTASMSLNEAARKMYADRTEAIVFHDGDVWGILTERDIVRFIAERREDARAIDLASRPLATVPENDSLFHARNTMLQRRFRHMGVVDDKDALIGLIGFGDILESIEQGYIDELESALNERESALRESEERYRALVEQSPDAIIVHRSGRILFSNQAGAWLLQYDKAGDLVGHHLSQILCPEHEQDNTEVTENRITLLSDNPCSTSFHERLRRRDGTRIDVEIAAMQISYDGRPASQLVLRDISRRKQLEDELRRLATTDQLTGAYNRLHFDSHLEHMMRQAQRFASPLSLLLLDIDHFKRANDEHGHHVGDRILCQLVDTIAGTLRATDILARWGGEEFAILAPETELAGALHLAEKIRVCIAETAFQPVGHVTLSCGVAQYRADEAADDFFRRVDAATYTAKRNGRNQVRSSLR